MRKAIVIPLAIGAVAIGAVAYINRDKIRKEVRKMKQSVAEAKAFADLLAQPASSPTTPGEFKMPTTDEASAALNEVLAELRKANAIPNTMCRP